MSDYTELKRLSEAATPGPWRYGKNADDVVADHPAGHADDPHGIDYYGGHLVAESIAASNRAFIAAANPAAVLALIAENEALVDQLCICPACHGQGEIFAGTWSDQGQWQPPDPDMDKCGECDGDGFIGTAEDLATVTAERDQLKAENETLRKDAARYQWMSTEGNWVARFHGKWRAHVGEYGDKNPTDWYPSRDEAIDAAMGQGVKS